MKRSHKKSIIDIAIDAMKREAASLQAKGEAINPDSLGNGEQALCGLFSEEIPTAKELEGYLAGLKPTPRNRALAYGVRAGMAELGL